MGRDPKVVTRVTDDEDELLIAGAPFECGLVVEREAAAPWPCGKRVAFAGNGVL